MRLTRLVLLVGAALLLAACPPVDDQMRAAEPYECPPEECDPPQPAGPGGALVVEAFEFDFEIVDDRSAEGAIEVTLINVGETEHDFVIDEAFEGGHIPPDGGTIGPGQEATGTMEIFAGEYVYYCSVPGHRQAGMEGTITIPAEPAEPVEADDPEVEEGAPAGDDEDEDEDEDDEA